jgi:glycosyltransferase involved in cell wall biosynthesis
MRVSMPHGRTHGWGIAGEYLTKEISKLPPLEGVTLHCMKGYDLAPYHPEDWDRINIGYCFFEDILSIWEHARTAARQWDFITAGSHWCEYALRMMGVTQTATILQGIDTDNFYPGPKLNYSSHFVIFSGGKFELRKGQDLVIAAMKVFMERHTDVLLSCAWHNIWPFSVATMEHSEKITFHYAEGDCDTILHETLQINGIPIERVILHPPQDNVNMRAIYLNSDVGLFPNRCEGGNNMVMCEYMACGRPVIASDMTGHADVISSDFALPLTVYQPRHYHHYAEGFWFEPSVEEIVEKLEYAYQQRRELKRLGLRAVEAMTRLSWAEAARQFHQIGTRISR